MTDPVAGNGTQRFRLSGRTPVLPVAVAASGCLFAAILLVMWGLSDRGTFVLVVAISVLVLGLAMTLGTFLFGARLRTLVVMDAETITVVRGRLRRTLRWLEIDEVTLRGSRVTLKGKPGKRSCAFVNPKSAADPLFLELVATIQQRLDDSRGLRAFQ